MSMSVRLTRTLWVLAGTGLLVLFIKAFVGDVYLVASNSMEPALHPGEWVFVRFKRGQPERGSVTVARQGGTLVVKRAVGMGGEDVQISGGGDLLVDGRRIDVAEPRAPMVPLFDSQRHEINEHFDMGSTAANPFERDGDGWLLDARGVARGSNSGSIRLFHGLHDGWIEADHSVRLGSAQVADGSVRVVLRVLEPGGRFRVEWTEQGDTYSLSLELGGPPELGGEELGLVRLLHREHSGLHVLAEARCELVLDAPLEVSLTNLEDRLFARVGRPGDAEPACTLDASGLLNSQHPRDDGGLGRSYGHRLLIGGEGCLVRVVSVDVARDLHWTHKDELGISAPCSVPIDSVFLLGDNSTSSRDSRSFGPVPVEDVVGRATWVVWPPGAIRRIPAPEGFTGGLSGG